MDAATTFPFIAGGPALCFVDTLGDRGGAGLERLDHPRALAAWLAAAGLDGGLAAEPTDAGLEAARRLREAIHRCALHAMRAQPLPAGDVALLNAAAAHPPLRPRLEARRYGGTPAGRSRLRSRPWPPTPSRCSGRNAARASAAVRAARCCS